MENSLLTVGCEDKCTGVSNLGVGPAKKIFNLQLSEGNYTAKGEWTSRSIESQLGQCETGRDNNN